VPSTVATAGLLLLHITTRSVAPAGDSVAVSVPTVLCSVSSRSVAPESAMPVTGIVSFETVISSV
jgi:hypothetical protein